MEFLSSDASPAILTEHHQLLRDACSALGIATPTSGGPIPAEVEFAARRHLEARRAAFNAAPHDMKPYSAGDPLQYLDPALAARATTTSLSESEVKSAELFSQFPEAVEFGASIKRHHFHLLPSRRFLNTGSYGATPKAVLSARGEWEQLEATDPHVFHTSVLPFRLRSATNRLAKFIGAHPKDVTLMVNANSATSTVLKSLPWEVGDALLLLSCDYAATKLAAEYLREMHGVESLVIDLILPMRDEDILQAVNDTLRQLHEQRKPLPKLANFCHVTSRTAWIFPVKELVDVCHGYGVPVMIDGAQAPGHFPLNVIDIGADWYVGTCHKWMFTCPGVAFLVSGPSKHRFTQPLVATSTIAGAASIGEEAGSASPFLGAVTTEDYSTLLSLHQAFDFVDLICRGWRNVWRYNAALAQAAVVELRSMWKLEQEGLDCIQASQVQPRTTTTHAGIVNCMPILPLPNSRGATEADARRAMGSLMTRGITAYLFVEKFRDLKGHVQSMLAVRLTCQVHVSLEDIRTFGNAILSIMGGKTTSLP